MKQRKIGLLFSAVAGCLLGTAILGYWFFYADFSSSKEHSYIFIDRDDNIDSVYTKLESAAHPRQLIGFKLLSSYIGQEELVKTGKYETGAGISTLQLVRDLHNKHQVPVRLVIPSARTMERLAAKVGKMIEPDSTELIQYFRNAAVCKQFGHTPQTLSCLFLPNTYEVYWDITPEQLLKKMEKENKRYWNEERRAKAQKQGLSLLEVMTLASIVDQETANDKEKNAIAGMYLNRLRKGMLLQADPTVKFALQQFGLRRILHEHLKTDSPYNTYRYKGLPPGPIAIPALASIEAVLNAEDNDYLYMCAKEDFSGTHNFARTYAEHLRNAKKYTQALNQRGIK